MRSLPLLFLSLFVFIVGCPGGSPGPDGGTDAGTERDAGTLPDAGDDLCANVVCQALDSCHQVGVCDPQTGQCTQPPMADGTGCDDQNACTQTDSCQAGICTGGNPVTCTALDACHEAGSCDPSTGACTQPEKADGTGCNDQDACTQTDTCQGGTCTGGNPVTCSAQDQCHLAGTCNPSTGVCSNPNQNDDTACNDGNACTQTDSCQGGTCTGANPVTCVAQDQCHLAGTCNPTTGVCSNPNQNDDTACNDGNACTQTDQCQAGSCVGADPVSCVASECREAGTCDSATGLCSGAVINEGGTCSDSDTCTTGDRCVAGACRSPQTVCTEGGGSHNCSIRSDGTLWCSGFNYYGQLGIGSTDSNAHSTPEQVGSATDWIRISAGLTHTCGIRGAGTLWCWGRNVLGEVGDGTTTLRSAPVQVGSGTSWRMVSAGYAHTCAIQGAGSVYCWGYNANAQLGDGTTTNRTSPVLISSASHVTVGTGYGHSCGLRTDGTLWCWGWNGSGQIGDNTQIRRDVPKQVETKTDWTSLGVGFYYNCALDAVGQRWCWGSNMDGSLGNGWDGSSYWYPIQWDSGTDWFSISSGISTTCATRIDGSLWCWGLNQHGQVGIGQAGAPQLSPVRVGNRLDWRSVVSAQSSASLASHVCGRREDGTRYCWGYNVNGQLGDGTTTHRWSPVPVP